MDGFAELNNTVNSFCDTTAAEQDIIKVRK